MTTVVVPKTSSRPGHVTFAVSFFTSERKCRKFVKRSLILIVLPYLRPFVSRPVSRVLRVFRVSGVSGVSGLARRALGAGGVRWQGCGDSNPEPTVLETAALPIRATPLCGQAIP